MRLQGIPPEHVVQATVQAACASHHPCHVPALGHAPGQALEQGPHGLRLLAWADEQQQAYQSEAGRSTR